MLNSFILSLLYICFEAFHFVKAFEGVLDLFIDFFKRNPMYLMYFMMLSLPSLKTTSFGLSFMLPVF